MSMTGTSTTGPHDHYDVVIAGARVAGASTAMLLARAGVRVLVVDPVEQGRDALSTHALMRGAVLQLSRWGLLERIVEAGTPAITTTTFHYGREAIRLPIKPRDGIDALYAPRRSLLDTVIVDAAVAAGAHVRHGAAVTNVRRDADGRVVGVEVSEPTGSSRTIGADLVIGADGLRSRVARLVEASPTRTAPHATASIYGYWPGLGADGYHWYYAEGYATGTIPTNDGHTCVYASLAPSRFLGGRGRGLESLLHDVVRRVSPALASRLASIGVKPRLRGFAGAPSVLREATGPGWALVGDAGYFKDPLTAHGITDALRDAELLARAVLAGTDRALLDYATIRDRLSTDFMDVTSEIASLAWSLDELKSMHLSLSRALGAEVEHMLGWDGAARSAA
jgi:2-polyprenyl-6-methoxyphenol hydroxylase-like FAD-dependent oxidoreductase